MRTSVAEFRRRLYLEAFCEEYPEEATTDGYITRSELSAVADALRIAPGAKMADLGCGRGGPGLWIATTTGATMVGIDFSEVALEQARARAPHADSMRRAFTKECLLRQAEQLRGYWLRPAGLPKSSRERLLVSLLERLLVWRIFDFFTKQILYRKR